MTSRKIIKIHILWTSAISLVGVSRGSRISDLRWIYTSYLEEIALEATLTYSCLQIMIASDAQEGLINSRI